MRLRLQLLAVGFCLSLALPERSPAQATTVDEGSLMVTRGGSPVGRESYRIVQAGPGQLLTATGQGVYGDRRLAPALSVDPSGSPVLYRFESRSGSAAEERIQATARGGRLSALRRTATSESAKEYLINGPTLLLDDEVFHQFAFVALAPPGSVSVVTPRRNVQRAAVVERVGPSRISIDSREVDATHYTVSLPDGVRDVWFDAAGRLLRVAFPSADLVASRESIPD
jgi:hypothetical protein